MEDRLVGVSHECDFPPQAKLKPKITSNPVPGNLSSFNIHQKIFKLSRKGSSIFHINPAKLKNLKPNLIFTQENCQVCAIGSNQVSKAAWDLDKDINIVSFQPESIGEIYENILLAGKLTGKSDLANLRVTSFKNRVQKIKAKLLHVKSQKPKVLVVEWLNPVMVAGHWVPEMIKKACGTNLISKKGQKSYPITYDRIVKASPDIVIFAPCGFTLKRTLKEKKLIDKICRLLGDWRRFYLMDGSSYITRPGPRIIDGVEIIAEILYPNIFQKTHHDDAWMRYYPNLT